MDQHLEDSIQLMQRRRSQKSEQYYLDLQENERALFDASSRIYAAYVARGAVGDEQVDAFISRSIHEAAKMAYSIERSVQDATENRPEVE